MSTLDAPDSGPALGSAEANRRFYETQAAIYDETEFCIRDAQPRARLRAALERALALLGDEPKALDAGGGTGNATLMLRERGLEPLLIDASPEMLDRYREKSAALGHRQVLAEEADLESFFVADERRWDLIVFSSVLHHLGDPAEVLEHAAGRLRTGGVIVTIFDPVEVDRTGDFLRKLDYALWIAVHSPATLLRAVRRRLGARLRPQRSQAPELNVGAQAERHAMSGLDDAAISRRVQEAGLAVVEHERIYDARHGSIVALSRRLARPTHFSLTFRSPAPERAASP